MADDAPPVSRDGHIVGHGNHPSWLDAYRGDSSAAFITRGPKTICSRDAALLCRHAASCGRARNGTCAGSCRESPRDCCHSHWLFAGRGRHDRFGD
eukprot:2881224-Rhodomonas_salina.1